MLQFVYKVPNGKLLKVKLELDEDDIISACEIRGDFFIYPEDGFIVLENFLIGKSVDGDWVDKMHGFIESQNIQLFGFQPQDLFDAINPKE